MRTRFKVGGAIALVVALAVTAAASGAGGRGSAGQNGHRHGCDLGSNGHGRIKHLVYLQFDNTHLLRDRTNFASDLELMPHLKNFLSDNGTLSDNHHTILISHTGGGILSALTGLYPDRTGQAVSNSYGFFRPNGSVGFSSTFKYWTDITDGGNPATDPPTPPGDTNFNMVNGDSGQPKNTPAPWVPWTRAGCDVGNISTANAVLENNNAIVFGAGPTVTAAAAAAGQPVVKVASVNGFTVGMHVTIDTGALAESKVVQTVGTPGAGGTGITFTTNLANAHASGVPFYGPTATDPTGDMTKVFGEGSPEWNEGRDSQIAPFATAARAKALTDFVGITIHCAAGGGICDDSANAKPDLLPDEPGGYTGFEGLFGAKYVNPAINDGAAAVDDTNGDPIVDPFGQPGFPGFDGVPAKVSLGYVAQMQEAGVPITFGYISDAHDNHQNAFPAPPDPNGVFPRASGPGESDYVQTLHEYDQAFATFFNRLRHDGITKQNTLFVVTVDENDHFAGGNSDDGTWSHTYCNVDAGQQCPANQIGEVNANLLSLIPSGQPNFSVHNDSAPTFYVNGNPPRTDATLRQLERDVAAAKATDPYISNSPQPDRAVPGGQGRREDAAHGDRGSAADAVVHAVREPGLLPDGREDLSRGADEVQLPGLGAPGVRLHRLPLRVEPRRCDGGHRASVARHGRARRGEPRHDERRLVGSPRRPADDPVPRRAPGQLRAGRPRADRVPRQPRPWARARSGPDRARVDLQADQRPVRTALVRRAARVDDGSLEWERN